MPVAGNFCAKFDPRRCSSKNESLIPIPFTSAFSESLPRVSSDFLFFISAVCEHCAHDQQSFARRFSTQYHLHYG